MKARAAEAPGALSVQEAEAQLATAQAELVQLQQRAAGSIEHRTTRREQHTVIQQTGRAEVVDVDVPLVETEHVGPLGRLRARRALADAEDRVALAEERLEEARLVAARDARAQRAEAIERGERAVQAELPRLIAQLRSAQQAMQAFAARMAELDRPLEGGRYFQEAVWVPLLSQQGSTTGSSGSPPHSSWSGRDDAWAGDPGYGASRCGTESAADASGSIRRSDTSSSLWAPRPESTKRPVSATNTIRLTTNRTRLTRRTQAGSSHGIRPVADGPAIWCWAEPASSPNAMTGPMNDRCIVIQALPAATGRADAEENRPLPRRDRCRAQVPIRWGRTGGGGAGAHAWTWWQSDARARRGGP
jgi:hypothetical protein